jgi:hypothetical protein
MARIRSIHPGLWTDDAFAGLSDAASLLYLGLLNEADDNGIFEWKPITLKMRLRPAKNETLADIQALLLELETANMIRPFSEGDRQYGAVRNFAKYQRPKLPNTIHPLPEVLWVYVGLTSEGDRPRSGTGRPPSGPTSTRKAPSTKPTSEVVRKDFGSASEEACQREEEGGRRKDGRGREEDVAVAGDDPDTLLWLSVKQAAAKALETPAADAKAAHEPEKPADVVVPDQAATTAPAEPRYAFEYGVIKLNEADWAKWKEAYPTLNLAGELHSMAAWAGRLKDEGKNWFQILPNKLIQLEREARREVMAVKARAEAEAKAGLKKSDRPRAAI